MNMCRTHAFVFLFVLCVFRFCECLETTTEYTTAVSNAIDATLYTDYSPGVLTDSGEVLENTSAAAAEKTAACQTEEELRVTEPKITARSIGLSWQPLSVPTKCNVKYDINITKAIYDPKEIPYFRHESRTSHNFARLKDCTAYNISIKPSSGKLYKTTLRTLPGKVYLELKEFSGHTYAEWEQSYNPECATYNITLGDQSFIQKNTTVDLGKTEDIRCTQFRITPLDTQNRTGEPITKTVPGQIRNLQATSENYVINLTWDPPEDSSCVESYNVKFGDQEYPTAQTKYSITNLEACTLYDGTVSAISDSADEGAPAYFSIRTTTPSSPGKPGDPTFHLDGEVMNTTWSPPDRMGACIKQYNIAIWDQNGITQNYKTAEPFYVIERVVPCKEYHFQVIAVIGTSESPTASEINTIGDRVTNAPQVISVTPGKTTLNFNVQLEGHSSNMCKITAITVECEFSGDDSEFLAWMIRSSSASLAYTDSTARPRAIVTVENLSEYTDYNCTVNVINSGGTSDGADSEGRTLEEVPSHPLNIKWEEAENLVNISWDPPFKVPGVIGPYRISINHTKFLHYTACAGETVNITSEYITETIFDFSDPEPNSEYALSIAASTSVGYGKVAEDVIITQPKASEKPREVEYEFNKPEGDNYDVTVTINWTLPCNTKGVLVKFRCILNGESIENGKEEIEEQDVPANEDISNDLYTATFALQALYNYTVQIHAITRASDEVTEIKGETEEVSFISPDGYPSAPLNLEIIEISSRTAVFRWEEPANKNGELTSYTVHVDVYGALHEVPEGCNHNTTNLEFILDPSENQYLFTGFPNYKYTVTMTAATSAGSGSTSEPQTFQTQGDVPESVRDVKRDKNEANEEIYNVELKVTFNPPCHTNGIFDHYEIELTGMRDAVSHKNTRNITNFNENEATFKLEPEHEYSGYITVHTDQNSSNKTTIPVDISPAGVPKTNNVSLSELDVIDSFTANFVLQKDTFDETNGKILYYSIILSAFNESATTEHFNFWQNGIWPESGFWSDDGDLKTYQTTPDHWNPFTDPNYRVFTSKADKSTITFKIGTKGSCDGKSYCNGKLRPDTAYHLRVRGFTSRAYRDTVPVKFTTPPKLNLGALIGGIVGACAALAIIFIAAFIFWRRRKRQHVKEDSLENPLIPVPIAIKAFVDHYNDYKTNLNKLKSEYTLLERKSAEQQLSTSFALTDDNKRKNRYINILPYDDTRVKLDRDKNDNYTDYINASFVKGYSDNVEYIATQGPLEQTVVDFWRMVIQENVSLIVMVAQFVEQNKPKCHQYFPNNHETMDIGDGIEIRCANELPFDGYVKRTLLVQRELMQMTITHLQFTEWPDFGCPNDTDSMLEFCNVMRQIVEQHKNKMVIHCSAGVGRTGTLIAIDILIQTIENKGDIDVFKTVLDLRKQRIRMVQTEKQYMFILSCLAQHIQNPKMPETKLIDPIYENVTIKQENGGTAESAL